jgi:hypothetical protein
MRAIPRVLHQSLIVALWIAGAPCTFAGPPSSPMPPMDSRTLPSPGTASGSYPFVSASHVIHGVVVSEKLLELESQGYRLGIPGGVVPLKVSLHHLPEGNGPLAQGEDGIGPDTVDALLAGIAVAARAVGYNPKYLSATVSLDVTAHKGQRIRIDGQSVGVGFAVVAASIILGDAYPSATCLTGTIEDDGHVGPVGGIYDKVEGCHSVFPRSRFILPRGQAGHDVFSNAQRYGVTLIEVETFEEAYEAAIGQPLRRIDQN